MGVCGPRSIRLGPRAVPSCDLSQSTRCRLAPRRPVCEKSHCGPEALIGIKKHLDPVLDWIALHAMMRSDYYAHHGFSCFTSEGHVLRTWGLGCFTIAYCNQTRTSSSWSCVILSDCYQDLGLVTQVHPRGVRVLKDFQGV